MTKTLSNINKLYKYISQDVTIYKKKCKHITNNINIKPRNQVNNYITRHKNQLIISIHNVSNKCIVFNKKNMQRITS